MNMMNKLIAALAIPVAISMASAPVANATGFTDFLTDVSSISGLTVTKSNEDTILVVGLSICLDLVSGVPVRSEYSDILDAGFTATQAQELLTAAVINLCPQAAERRSTT